jgi:hypothetical protein
MSEQETPKDNLIEIIIKNEPNPNGNAFMNYIDMGKSGKAIAHLYLPNIIQHLERNEVLTIRHYWD